MAWSRRQEILDATGIQATEVLSAGFIMDRAAVAHVMVNGDLGGTTDDLLVNLYSNIDPKTKVAAAPTIAAGGTSYTVGDILTLTGGTFETAATVRVLTLGGSDAVLTVELVEDGDYSVTPSNPITTSGGTGSGCTLNATWDGNNWDTEPFDTVTLTAVSGVKIQSFLVSGYQRVRVGLVGGSTDSHDATVWMRFYDPAL